MIVPSDKDYKETKLVKQGKAALHPDFKVLAEWIDKEYNVKVLNIYYDVTTGAYNKPFPRLNIIFEHQEEELKFRDGFLGNFHSDKQKVIAKKFDEFVNGMSEKTGVLNRLFKKARQPKYDTKSLLVIFNSFKPIARDEANEKITKSEIDNLKAEINIPEIWEISRFASSVTFFFYTERQVELAKINGYVQQLTEKYFDLLKKYDEFNYFDRQTFSVSVDSKENFDTNFESNWYYYYK